MSLLGGERLRQPVRSRRFLRDVLSRVFLSASTVLGWDGNLEPKNALRRGMAWIDKNATRSRYSMLGDCGVGPSVSECDRSKFRLFARSFLVDVFVFGLD